MRSVLLGVALCSVGCAVTPLQPSAPLVPLTVKVLDYADQHSPIAGAVVSVTGVAGISTCIDGLAVVSVPVGTELTVEAHAPGYAGFSATGTLHNAETWTFYLTADARLTVKD